MNKTLKSADIDLIQHIIPHRYPLLRVVEIDGTARGGEIKSVAMNRSRFTGHFPGMPVFRRIYMVEAMAQTPAVVEIGAAPANGRFDGPHRSVEIVERMSGMGRLERLNH